ncbi:uncharacterized protein LOC106168754 [Lingula anatina]|uniref:Uncharacterized protein LOC106168754 n=1 Tax=Lingula anatina TaxID=7574 RepID=A0A1S3IZD6_LINAN|nr:uncharacterized protein LOC106168754 [Lingula anatina]|eukprot:XP_013403378.1 uncharacterized protein LOC106168754 [Lingula anatina]
MCPHHLVWYNTTLVYHAADSTRRFLQSSTELSRLIASQAAVSVLGNEIYTQPFSFMEYKSMEGEMIKLLAKHYKNSTFISLHSELEEAEKLYQETWKMNVTNIVITSLAVDQDFTTKLLQSPDFLRYQYFGVQAFLDSVMTMGDDEFNLMVGQMIANGVTSFFQLPSAEMLSLAFATFFPESFTGRPLRGNGTLDRKDIYYLKHHPAPVFENAELKMLGESAEADVNISISAELLQPPFMQSASFPWKMVRVDVRNLTVTVNHHFDYQLDGHDRKYTLHCLAHSKSTYEVYLIRKGDGFKIPYGDVHAISLIALLRMGLLEPIKTMFYDLFLTLPFYEDMAPWNIVFRSGRLEYIDYDTKDFTFNKMVPAAYQVMAMLMNYERTINDFGHCKQHGINQYNFPYVSHCVGSDYEGPCKDSRYPVPCGDYTCKSTYIECLKSLSELEKKKMEWKQQMVANLKTPGFVYTGRQNLPYTSGQWSFGQFGAKNPQNGAYLRQRPPQQKSYSGPQFAQDNQRRRFW